jgi:aspartyl-tRNA(Asn)/glutamyl-tRNA(Gln) amidotransferase subunit A
MNIDLNNLTIRKASSAMKRGDFSARELAEAYLDEIKKKNPSINAYLEIYDDVLKQADEAQKYVGKNVLAGIPLAIKDNILIKGRRVQSASKILDGYIAPYDATAIEKLKKEHVVFIGRANMDEFAMGGSTENSAFGVTKNPSDESRVAGGSSGGSVAAVAMDGALAALGSDTGGSVRQPASFCGVVGLKPTYGSVSRHGLMAMGSSLDVIGPIGKCVDDVEILFNAIKGKDRFDSTSIDIPEKSKIPKKIGVPKGLLSGEGLDKAVAESFTAALERFRSLGFDIVEIDMPSFSYALAVYYVIMPAEVSTNLARFDGVKYGLHKDGVNSIDDYFETRREGFGPEARRRIMLGAYVLSSGYYDAYYGKAAAVRELIKADFAKAFETVDLIATPTAPTPAFRIGEKTSDPVAMYLADIFTVTANLAGVPAISLPAGVKDEGGKKLPIGIQLMARHEGEGELFYAGKKLLGEVE